MESVGLRELRWNTPELLRRVENGERIEVTVAGRPSVVLVPADSRRWRSWSEVADVFEGPAGPDRAVDRDQIDHELRDPWSDR